MKTSTMSARAGKSSSPPASKFTSSREPTTRHSRQPADLAQSLPRKRKAHRQRRWARERSATNEGSSSSSDESSSEESSALLMSDDDGGASTTTGKGKMATTKAKASSSPAASPLKSNSSFNSNSRSSFRSSSRTASRSSSRSNSRSSTRSPTRSNSRSSSRSTRSSSRSPSRSTRSTRSPSRSKSRSSSPSNSRSHSRSPAESSGRSSSRFSPSPGSESAAPSRRWTLNFPSRTWTQSCRSPDRREYRSRSPLRSVAVIKSRRSGRSCSRSARRSRSRSVRRSRCPVDEMSSPDAHSRGRRGYSMRRTRSRTPVAPPRFYPVNDNNDNDSSSPRCRSRSGIRVSVRFSTTTTTSNRSSQALDSSKAVELYRQRHHITVASLDTRPMPAPVTGFRDVGLPEFSRRQMEQRGYAEFSPVQAQVWPLAVAGRNVVMISSPGTGQTLAFVLPAIRYIFRSRLPGSMGGPSVLLLVASRDAAIQLHQTADAFAFPGMRSICIAGSAHRQASVMDSLHLGCDLMVSTPSRILHILKKNSDEDDGEPPLVDLHRCLYVVIDGIDRMLEVGLEGQMVRIIQHLRPDTQLLASSFAWSRGVQRIARRYMGDYTMVRVGEMASIDLVSATRLAASIRQRVRVVEECAKLECLKEELTTIYDASDSPGKILVFVQRRCSVDQLVTFVRVFVHCNGIHSGRTALDRDESMRQFRQDTCNILITTDLLSCGMDLPGIRFVINYDFPESLEGYVRRMAKLATICTKDCEAISFFTRDDERLARSLAHHLLKTDQPIDQGLLDMVRAEEARGARGRSGRSRRDYGEGLELELGDEAVEEARARRKRMRNRRRAQLRRLNRLRKNNR